MRTQRHPKVATGTVMSLSIVMFRCGHRHHPTLLDLVFVPAVETLTKFLSSSKGLLVYPLHKEKKNMFQMDGAVELKRITIKPDMGEVAGQSQEQKLLSKSRHSTSKDSVPTPSENHSNICSKNMKTLCINTFLAQSLKQTDPGDCKKLHCQCFRCRLVLLLSDASRLWICSFIC